MQCHAIPCNTMQFHAIHYNTIQHHALPCNTMQYHAIPCMLNNCWRSVPLPCGQYMAIFIIPRQIMNQKKLLLIELIACRERERNIHYLGQVLGEGVLKGKLLGTMRTSVSDGRGIVKVDYVTTSYFWWKISYLGGCEDERGEDELFFSEALQMEFYQLESKKAHRQRFHYSFFYYLMI